MKSKIKSIKCKYCNKKLGSVTQQCGCSKLNKWNNPRRESKTLRSFLERKNGKRIYN